MDFDYVVLPALIVLSGILIIGLSVWRILSLRKGTYPVRRRMAERIILSLVILAATAVAVSSGFNAIALHHFRSRPPGEMYAVNGYKMRLDCTGTGSPTIILDAGGGNDGLTWARVQPVLAKSTRVCSYDRAGMGWSDVQPAPRDADHIAAELHGLLAAAGINGSIVLMGHSIGGIYIRDYATRYPDEVAGLIFVDSSTPLQNRNEAFKAFDGKGAPWYVILLNRGAFIVGIPRLLGLCSESVPGFDLRVARLVAEDRCHEQFGESAGEMKSFDRSGEETVHTGPYGALPILIFSHEFVEASSDSRFVNIEKASSQMQEDLKRLSTRSRSIVVRNSGHFIQLDRPDLIEKEVPQFIEQIRGRVPEPVDYGSTTTE
jgi:pimeloyl-ACP methyl ester carboxylesterase